MHNGDVDTEAIGSQVESVLKGLPRLAAPDIELRSEWWDIRRLVDLAMTPPLPGTGHGLADRADPSIFPPLVQPFARLALDSLQKDQGARAFDYGVLDLLVENWLPLGRSEVPDRRLSDGAALSPGVVYLALTEMALFARMLEVECRRVGQGNTLPVLEAILRIQCRVIEHLRRIPKVTNERKRLRETLALVTDQFVAQATLLLGRLESTTGAPNGLALMAPGERVSFPLRTLRLCGYVALAGLASHWQEDSGSTAARTLAERLHRVTMANPGGALDPVTDDQVIELGLVCELLLRTGLRSECALLVQHLVDRLGRRRGAHLPLPANAQLATWPPHELSVRTLVAAHAIGPHAAPGFVDSTSTILTLALYVTHRLSAVIAFPWQPIPHLQTCQPPQDAPEEWYVRRLTRGTARTYVNDEVQELPRLASAIDAANQPIGETPAGQWNQQVIDRMAWLLWRTRPPFAIFKQLIPSGTDPMILY